MATAQYHAKLGSNICIFTFFIGQIKACLLAKDHVHTCIQILNHH